MKTFEEKWTAWLDDQLAGKELADFEASLPDRAAAEAEKQASRKLGLLLKRELSPSLMTNEDFFSHQLRERIVHEDDSKSSDGGGALSGWWTIPRLVWSGAAAIALFIVCATVVMNDEGPMEYSADATRVLNAQIDPVGNPNATYTMFEDKKDQVTVLWTEGLKTLPSEYAAK